MRKISQLTRSKPGDIGPLSVSEINRAFEEVVGGPPVDESAVMLQRLPALGRIEAESRERQFIDHYILDGLRAENLIDIVSQDQKNIITDKWLNPLGSLGISLLSKTIHNGKNASHYLHYLEESLKGNNHVLGGDLLASFIRAGDNNEYDMMGLEIGEAHFKKIDMSSSKTHNYKIKKSIIESIDVTNTDPDSVEITDCFIRKVYGIGSEEGVPEWLKNNEIEDYESITTVSRIRTSNLGVAHRIFVTIIKKTFFQPGAGRKEEALLRGLGKSSDKKIADKILKKLVRERILEKFQGDEGWVFKPKRHHTKRMKEIINKLTLSKDKLWKEIDNIK